MNLSRVLGCVGAVALCVAACNDKDVSLISPDAGVGGSGTGGSAGSSGSGGAAGSGTAGSSSGGSGGSAGSSSAGSAGMSGSAGMPGMDPDAGDSGTSAGPYAAICESYCAVRTAWATATGDAGVNCPGWDSAGCQASCELEFAGFSDPPFSCGSSYTAAVECYVGANRWYCQDDVVFADNCESGFCLRSPCDSTCNTQAAAFNACLGVPACSP